LFAEPIAPRAPTGPIKLPAGIASYDQLIARPQDQLDQLLGLKPKYDIPGAARALRMVGVVDETEGGLPSTLANQNADLLRAALTGNGGQMVSRWGHILLRRALVSRMDAPQGADPADFVATRAALLLRMGEAAPPAPWCRMSIRTITIPRSRKARWTPMSRRRTLPACAR
jgi:hypothetical protein